MTKTKNTPKVTIDKLAVMINNGFVGMEKTMGEMKRDINELKQGQERIELRLTNVAYRFELQELQVRIDILEKKAGIKK
jgi:SMC interacting uncharacterized protein involved in chromosome segregation